VDIFVHFLFYTLLQNYLQITKFSRRNCKYLLHELYIK
jgi:hypothetical protein